MVLMVMAKRHFALCDAIERESGADERGRQVGVYVGEAAHRSFLQAKVKKSFVFL